MLIGELADAGGVPGQTLRFYERKGLLPQPGRGANGYRVYDESTLNRLHFIKVAQGAGLSLAEIGSIITLRDGGTIPCTHVSALVENKLTEVRERIRQLAGLQTELEALVERSHLLDPADCADTDICHIISARADVRHVPASDPTLPRTT